MKEFDIFLDNPGLLMHVSDARLLHMLEAIALEHAMINGERLNPEIHPEWQERYTQLGVAPADLAESWLVGPNYVEKAYIGRNIAPAELRIRLEEMEGKTWSKREIDHMRQHIALMNEIDRRIRMENRKPVLTRRGRALRKAQVRYTPNWAYARTGGYADYAYRQRRRYLEENRR